MSSEKKFLPKLYPVNKDISKTWFVLYTAQNGTRPKIYGQLNHIGTLQGRLLEADRIISQILQTSKIKAPVKPGNQLLKDLEEVYNLRLPGWKPKTASAYQTHLYSFARWYRDNGCPVMDSKCALMYLNTIIAGGGKPTTRNNYKTNLKSLFADLLTFFKHRYTDNPFTGIKKLREARKTKEWFRPAQIKIAAKEIKRVDPLLYLSVKIMYHCFARPNEIRQLRIADINFETQKMRIESSVAKISRIRFVPIPPEMLQHFCRLKKYPENYYIFSTTGVPGESMLSRDNLSKRHKLIMAAMNMPAGYTFYSWKNTGAVKMLMEDKKTMRYISKCMGHHSLDMTDKYFESLGVDEMGSTINFPKL